MRKKFYSAGVILLEDIIAQSNTGRKSLRMSGMLETVLWILFTAALILKCSHFQFSTKLNEKPYFSLTNANMLLATLTSVMVLISFAIAVFNKKRLMAMIIIDIVMSSLLLADTIYYRYYYNAVTVPVFYQIGLVGSLKDAVKSLLKPDDLIFAADFPLLAAGIFARNAGNAADRSVGGAGAVDTPSRTQCFASAAGLPSAQTVRGGITENQPFESSETQKKLNLQLTFKRIPLFS